ncbi:MAG: peptidylprolyl isomerase [Gemmatimonadota bacterium]|nr:peptidylprolyl isomerase [Gemmatimonadota bacterium]
MVKNITIVLAVLLAAFCILQAQEAGDSYIADDIAAVVGDEIILSSQIKMNIIQMAQEQQISLADSAALNRLAEDILENEISDRILLHHARQSEVEITDDQVAELVQNHMADLRRRYRSEEDFRRDLAEAGQTLLGLKEMYREQAREELLRQGFLQEHSHDFPRVKISLDQAREFFDNNITGTRPEQIKFIHMVITPTPSEQALAKAKTKIDSVYKMLLDGADFGYLAENFSDGPSASDGGNLGYFSKGEMVKEFEEAAFSMTPGEVRMVKTKFGWHLVRVEARRQKEVRTRHILAMTEITDADWERAHLKAKSIRQRVLDGESFFELAKQFSQDKDQLYESPPWMNLNSLQDNIQAILSSGEMTPLPDTTFLISDVHEVRPNGQLIIQEMGRKPAALFTFEEVSQQIIKRLQQEKAIQAYVEKLREKTYVDIRFKGWYPDAGGN